MYRPRAQTVTERYRYVICGENLADLIKMGVEEVLFVMDHRPTCHYRTASGYDACQTFLHHIGVSLKCSCMYCEIIHTLFSLFDERVTVYLPCEILHFSIDFFKSLIYRNSPDRDRAITDDPFACLVYIVTCRKVHESVTSPVAAPHCFAHLLFDA